MSKRTRQGKTARNHTKAPSPQGQHEQNSPNGTASTKHTSTLRALNLRRALSTIAFAIILFAAHLCPALRLECTTAVIAGCLLGALQGAGAAGLCAIAHFVKNTSPTLSQVALLAGSFLAALVSGLICFALQGAPQKHFSPIALLKSLAACAAGFGAFYVCQVVLEDGFAPLAFLALDALKCAAATLLSATLRPQTQRFLFPREMLEDEMTEMTAKLKKH